MRNYESMKDELNERIKHNTAVATASCVVSFLYALLPDLLPGPIDDSFVIIIASLISIGKYWNSHQMRKKIRKLDDSMLFRDVDQLVASNKREGKRQLRGITDRAINTALIPGKHRRNKSSNYDRIDDICALLSDDDFTNNELKEMGFTLAEIRYARSLMDEED